MKTKLLIIIFLLISFGNKIHAQGIIQNAKYTQVTYYNYDTKSGAYATVKIDYLVRKVDKSEVFINLSVSDFQINSSQGYGYNGKLYGNEVPGLVQALDVSRASNPVIVFKVYYGGNLLKTITSSVTANNNLNGFSGDGFAMQATEEQIKNPSWFIEAVELKSFSINPEYYTFTNLIDKHLKLTESKESYKKQLNVAERALGNARTAEEYSNAKAEFYEASRIAPEESYPKNQIERINVKIEEIKREQRDSEAEKKRLKEEEAKITSEEDKEKIEKRDADKKSEPEKKAVKEKTDAEKEAARLEFERRQKESQAKALEVEGDTFNALGSMFMDSALEKYNQAQLIYYSATVQVKIDKINGIKAAVNLVNEGMEKVDEFLSDTQQTFDDAGWPRWRVTSFSYEALAPSFKGFETQKVIVPEAYSVSYGFYRLIALEVGLKYQESPVYKFGLEDNNGKYINKDTEASNTTLGPELLLGLGGGGEKLAFYVMYGYYFPFILSGTSHTTGYEYNGDIKDAFGITTPISKLKAGIFFRIPKTNIGIGVYYCMNGVNGEKLLEGGSVDVIDRSRGLDDIYGLGPGNNSSLDRLKYNSIGFSFIIKDRD